VKLTRNAELFGLSAGGGHPPPSEPEGFALR
jgi:hypothetical protein